MNWWGFIVKSKTGRVIFHDFGYDTEQEAIDYGHAFIDTWAEGAELIVKQRWSELDEDPNEFIDEEDEDD